MKTIQERVEAIRPEIRAVAHQIHEDPELGMQEFHAVAALTDLLEKQTREILRMQEELQALKEENEALKRQMEAGKQ